MIGEPIRGRKAQGTGRTVDRVRRFVDIPVLKNMFRFKNKDVWIPAFAGMTSIAGVKSFPRRRESRNASLERLKRNIIMRTAIDKRIGE